MRDDSLQLVMVIPTYWSRETNSGWKEGDAVYDHPTPIDEEGTLLRTLESVQVLEDLDVTLVILAVATSVDIASAVEQKVLTILKEFKEHLPQVEMYFFGQEQLNRFHQVLTTQGHEEWISLLRLRGYANIRNLCLILPHLLGGDVAVLIDDDELFEDSQYLHKVRDVIATTVGDEPVYGLTGYVINPDGQYTLQKRFQSYMNSWPKITQMNKAFTALITTDPRVKPSPLALGGNMVIHQQLFSQVPFDPCITRGEDTDYLLNAKLCGFQFFFDNQLAIRHDPPEKSHPAWKRMREDIYRFVYERAKLTGQTEKKKQGLLTVDDLDPYPGYFLRGDLEQKIERASRLLADEYDTQGDQKGREEAVRNIQLASSDAVPHFNPYTKFLVLQEQWSMFMAYLSTAPVKAQVPRLLVPIQ